MATSKRLADAVMAALDRGFAVESPSDVCSLAQKLKSLLVRRMFALINTDGCTLEELATRSGVDSQTINSWRSRKSPQLITFEAIINALGWKLTIVPLGEAEGSA